MDSKAVATDLYKLFDDDKDNLVTVTELIDGFLNMLESFGTKIKSEFRESISSIAEIIRVSNKGDLILPKRKIIHFFNQLTKEIEIRYLKYYLFFFSQRSYSYRVESIGRLSARFDHSKPYSKHDNWLL